MSVSQALDHFISSYGDLDEALREYACNLIDDVDDDSGGEEVVEQLGELLSGACPRFASAPDAERTQAVLELFQAARRGCGGASSSGAAPGGGGALAESVTAEAVVARMRQMQLDALAAEGGCLPRTSSSGGGAGGGGVGGCSSSGAAPSAAAAAPDDVENADPQALAALRELCSDVASDTFLAYILVRRHAGDTEVRRVPALPTLCALWACAPGTAVHSMGTLHQAGRQAGRRAGCRGQLLTAPHSEAAAHKQPHALGAARVRQQVATHSNCTPAGSSGVAD